MSRDNKQKNDKKDKKVKQDKKKPAATGTGTTIVLPPSGGK
jgi:hypothetical protein